MPFSKRKNNETDSESPVSSESIPLSSLMSNLLPPTEAVDLANAGPYARKLTQILPENPQGLNSLIATFFWQAFIHSPAFEIALSKQNISPLARTTQERFIVRHGSGSMIRHDLVIFDPGKKKSEHVVIPALEAFYKDLIQGWIDFRRHVSTFPSVSDQLRKLLEMDVIIPNVAVEVMSRQAFGIVVLPQPEIETSAWALSPQALSPQAPAAQAPAAYLVVNSGQAASMAGVVASNIYGKIGVTAASHAIDASLAQVTVGTLPGKVVTRDITSDSCFIEIPGFSADGTILQPLTGRTPGQEEQVHFQSAVAQQLKYTRVIGWTPELPYSLEFCQSRVLTDLVTTPGDSGTALLTTHNEIVGFAFYHTAINARGAHSAWIWAESVFTVHELK